MEAVAEADVCGRGAGGREALRGDGRVAPGVAFHEVEGLGGALGTEKWNARWPLAKNTCGTFMPHPPYAAFVASTAGTGGEGKASGNICWHWRCRGISFVRQTKLGGLTMSASVVTMRETKEGWSVGAVSWRKPTSLQLGLRCEVEVRGRGRCALHYPEP